MVRLINGASLRILLAGPITRRCMASIRDSSAIRKSPDGSITLQLHVKPGAKLSRITNIDDHQIGMQIAAPPRDGEANEEVIRYTAELLGIKHRQLQLLTGLKSRDKVVRIEAGRHRHA